MSWCIYQWIAKINSISKIYKSYWRILWTKLFYNEFTNFSSQCVRKFIKIVQIIQFSNLAPIQFFMPMTEYLIKIYYIKVVVTWQHKLAYLMSAIICHHFPSSIFLFIIFYFIFAALFICKHCSLFRTGQIIMKTNLNCICSCSSLKHLALLHHHRCK